MAGLPEFFEPQLATLVKAPPSGDDYVYEIKYDGYRMLCRVDRQDVRLFSRTGNDWTERLRPLADGIAAMDLGAGWLDGEVVAFDENGVSDFGRLQNMLDRKIAREVKYAVFDVPFWGGDDLRDMAFIERAEYLKGLLGAVKGPIILSTVVELNGAGAAAALVRQACEMGMEGLIGKRRDAPYRSGRTNTWIKLPCRKKDEFVVVGWTTGEGSRASFGALVLGQFDDGGVLRYAGTVGSGFSGKTIDDLMKTLGPLQIDAPLMEGTVSGKSRWGGARNPLFCWVKPEVVVEVAFKERTKGGQLRQSSFLGIRKDKPAAVVRTEKIGKAAKQ